MNWKVLVVALILVISPTYAAEVHMFMDKNSVNLGDYIRFQVSVEVNRSVDIAVVGESGDGTLLCHLNEGEDLETACGSEWVFKIPEDWDEGKYFFKVVINDITPEEHLEEFRVIKPKIKGIEIPRLVYQGEYEVVVYAETASSAKISLKLFGNNRELYYEEEADYEEDDSLYSTTFKLNLAENYERTRDVADAITPGKYILEVKLKYGGKIWDARRFEVSVEEPQLVVSVPEEVKPGEPVVVEISSNREDDVDYDGIIVVLSGNNFLIYKKAHLDEDGKAKVQFETAGLEKGMYKICVRDTSKTTSIPLSELAENSCDLDPESGYAKIIQAHDDVFEVKYFWIVGEGVERARAYFNPPKVEIFENESFNVKVLIERPYELNSYELVILTTSDAVNLESLSLPNGFRVVEKSVHGDYAKIVAFADEKISTATLAEVKILAVKPGEAWLRLKNVKLYSEKTFLDVNTEEAWILVKKGRSGGNIVNVNISAVEKENATESLPTTTITSEGSLQAATLPTTTITETAEQFSIQLLPVEEIDYTKVAMFTGSFLATYIAGKTLRKRMSLRQGKKKQGKH